MNEITIVAYRISQGQSSVLDTRKYRALGHGAIFPTVESAEDAVLDIFRLERRRFEQVLADRGQHPSAQKKAWDDRVCSTCLIEERIADWRIVWNSSPSGSQRTATVYVDLEQRVAWRDVRQITRTTETGLEVVHEPGEVGEWSDWGPALGSMTYVPHLELSIVPHTLTLMATKKEARSWLAQAL